MTNEQKIKEACIKANPDINHYCCKHDTVNPSNYCDHCLVRDIHLADVLLAIGNIDLRFLDHCHLTLTGKLCLMTGKDIYWNLRADSLSDQTEQTKQFLADLLDKE